MCFRESKHTLALQGASVPGSSQDVANVNLMCIPCRSSTCAAYRTVIHSQNLASVSSSSPVGSNCCSYWQHTMHHCVLLPVLLFEPEPIPCCSIEIVVQAVEEEDEEGKTDEFGGGMLRKRQRAARREQQSDGETADLQQVTSQSLLNTHTVYQAKPCRAVLCHAMPCIAHDMSTGNQRSCLRNACHVSEDLVLMCGLRQKRTLVISVEGLPITRLCPACKIACLKLCKGAVSHVAQLCKFCCVCCSHWTHTLALTKP